MLGQINVRGADLLSLCMPCVQPCVRGWGWSPEGGDQAGSMAVSGAATPGPSMGACFEHFFALDDMQDGSQGV